MTRAGGAWRVTWHVAGDVRIAHVAAPHGRFHADDRDLDLTAPADIALDVSIDDRPGTLIENAFLILTAESGGKAWRILARMRVGVADDGTPRPAVERIDVQEVGFSGQR